MSPEKLSALYRRWRDGQRLSEIARNEGLDRKTIRKYLAEFAALELDQIPVGDGRFVEGLDRIALGNMRPLPTASAYEPYLEEIRDLIQHEHEPLKPKTAWDVVRRRHELTASYSAFKRFVAKQQLVGPKSRPGIRIEMPAGDEVQIDYGQVGAMIGPDGKRHIVYAFVAVLSYSRKMFIQFTFHQTSSSFVQSHVLLFSYLGGVPRRVVIDNLKSGILKADFWDPELNHAYRELAEHYDTFIDPARV
ncbi:MAG: transposase [Spirochaetes bacterium]|nr:transposase [Spirochaetota bacterium]